MKQKLAQRRSEGRVCLCLGCERTNKKEGSNNLSRGGARMSLVRCGGLCSRCQARKRKKKERREQASACLMCLWRVFLFVWLLLLNCQVQKIIENRCQLSPISQTGSAFPGVVRKRKEAAGVWMLMMSQRWTTATCLHLLRLVAASGTRGPGPFVSGVGARKCSSTRNTNCTSYASYTSHTSSISNASLVCEGTIPEGVAYFPRFFSKQEGMRVKKKKRRRRRR